MKIIGKVEKETYIVEITGSEISNVCFGAYIGINVLRNGNGETRRYDELKADDIIDVSNNYQTAKNILDEYEGIKKSLSSLKGHCSKFQSAVISKIIEAENESR